MGSGTRNILRYAPLYYPNYKVEINNGVQFIFSITYMEMSQEISENVSVNSEMSQETYVELIDEDLNISLNLGNSGCISEKNSLILVPGLSVWLSRIGQGFPPSSGQDVERV